MLTFYNEHHAQHTVRAATGRGAQAPCPDRAEHVTLVLRECERRGLGAIVTPHSVSPATIERVHSPRYLHFLRNAWSEFIALDAANLGQDALPYAWPVRTLRADIEPDAFGARLGLYSMDSITPITAGAWSAAKSGADCAVNAAHALRRGERGSFALTRPPGHHAGADFFGGGCFLNNAALAAQHLLDDGLERVAILDLGYHHGNGTQGIFYERSNVLFVSLHADPHAAWPFYLGHADETGSGAGAGYTMNIPLPADSTGAHWFAALETACVKIGMAGPQALVVSLGVDTHAVGGDARFGLQGGDFLRLGERIAHLGLPTAFMFEGGHAGPDTAVNTVNVLEGFETAAE